MAQDARADCDGEGYACGLRQSAPPRLLLQTCQKSNNKRAGRLLGFTNLFQDGQKRLTFLVSESKLAAVRFVLTNCGAPRGAQMGVSVYDAFDDGKAG